MSRHAVIAAIALFAGATTASADHYPGHHGSIYGPKSGTGTNYYPRQPNSGSDAWNQPRQPSVQHQWDKSPGTNPWTQPRQPDLQPWGKPKY